MAPRRSNQPRKLPAKTAPATKTNEDIVGDKPDENAADVPAGTDENMAPDEDVLVTQEPVIEDEDNGDAEDDVALAPERFSTAPGIPVDTSRTSIDPDSDVEAPHMDAGISVTSEVQNYVDDLPDNSFRKSWKEVLDESGVVPPQGRILFPDEPITYEGFEVDGDQVVLTKDIYRMVLPFRSTRPTFTLLARAGRTVPKGQLLSKSAYEKVVRTLHAPEGE